MEVLFRKTKIQIPCIINLSTKKSRDYFNEAVAALCIDMISGNDERPLSSLPGTLQSGRLMCPTRNVLW